MVTDWPGYFPKSLLENLPAVGGIDLDLPGQDAACR
jgi:hypothetical protein